jgi:hypothetical protein
MDLKELKSIIRASIKKKLREIAVSSRNPITDFAEFKREFSLALENLGAPETLVLEIQKNVPGHAFDSLYEAWQGIQVELSYVPAAQRINVWNDAVEHYVRKAVLDMASVHMNPSSQSVCYDGLEYDPAELSEKVVHALMR